MKEFINGTENEVYLASSTQNQGGATVMAVANADGTCFSSAITLYLDVWKSGMIYESNEFAYFKFTATKTGNHTIRTTGSLPSFGYLYNSNYNVIASKYGGGDNGNMKMVAQLQKGKTYYIAVRTPGIASGSFSINVIDKVFVESICLLMDDKITIQKGEHRTLNAVACPTSATQRGLFWESENPDVAIIGYDSDGERAVVGISEGKATIKVSATDGSGKKESIEVTVKDEVLPTHIVMTTITAAVALGGTLRLDADVKPCNATDKSVEWNSSNTSVATVNSSGLVTGVGVGSAIITVKSVANPQIERSCTINVVEKKLDEPTIEPPPIIQPGALVHDPIDAYTGAHLLKNTVMSLFGGLGLKLTLEYNSLRLAPGVFGKGWYHNFEKRLESDWSTLKIYTSPSTYLKFVTNDACQTFICTDPSKNGYVVTAQYSEEYPYELDCNRERKEYYDSLGRLVRIVDHQGFVTLIGYDNNLITVTDTVSSKKIYLQTDSSGKVTRVFDDASREAVFTYTNDSLVSIRDVNGNTLSYTYNSDGQTLSGTDGKGIEYFRNVYDSFGRVVRQKDGICGSRNSEIAYEEDGKRTITDRNGNTSIRIFNDIGLLTSHTDENGNTITYEYDSRYNVTKETDALGNSIIKEYGSFNKPTVITDKNGNKTHITYDNEGNVLRIQYPEVDGVIPEETFNYNGRNQMFEHFDLRRTYTQYTYDTNGMPRCKIVGEKRAATTYYENGLLKSTSQPMGNTTRYTYNNIGQMASMTDAEGFTSYFEYDAAGNLLKTTDPHGKTVINTYDSNHQKTSTIDKNNNWTQYFYNGNMKNDVVIFPDGSCIKYEFDGEDRPVEVIDQMGNITTTEYDKAGRPVKKTFADGGFATYEYDKAGNVLKETGPCGAVTEKTYDKMGNVLTVKDNDGNTTTYLHNAMNKVVRMTNAVEGTTVYTYSLAGDLLSETDKFGNTVSYTYDAYGNVLTKTDKRGGVTTNTYDENDNLLTVKNALNQVTTYTYDSMNRVRSVTDAKGNTVSYCYDALGRRTTIIDAKNNVFTTNYDANGNVLSVVDAKGNKVSEKTYNSLNLVATDKNAVGNTTSYTYTPLGKVETVVDPMGHMKAYSYDTMGHIMATCDEQGSMSFAGVDTLGNVMYMTDPRGATINYTRDALSRVIKETTTSGSVIKYGYNELGVKDYIKNARGQERCYSVDALGRITGYVGAEDSVSYTHDKNGNVLTVTDKNGTVSREFDALNRVTKYTDTYGKSIRYEYDAVGNLSRLIYPDNTSVRYIYDVNNNLISVIDWAGRITAYTYDENNRVIGAVKPDGSITTTAYDAAGRVTSTVERTQSGEIITGFEYTYDNLSRIVEEKHLAENEKVCYTYDVLSRVTNKTVYTLCDEYIFDENYTYDESGNIICDSHNNFSYDYNNKLTWSSAGWSLSYDLDGNMLSDGISTYGYDSANRLISAGGHTYTYNAENTRIRNLCSDSDTTYTYNTNCRLSQLLTKTENGITTKYVYGLGLIGEENCEQFKTYHFDYRGSTVAITDECGNITDTFEYDVYGNQTVHYGNSVVIFGYNGRDGVVTDKNGLIYMRARYYSPSLRRFVNADILHGDISDPATLNRYAYVNGNPVSFVDPMGMERDRGGKTAMDYIPNFNKYSFKHWLEEIYKSEQNNSGKSQLLQAYNLTSHQYHQLIKSSFNNKLNSVFGPNVVGGSEIISYGSLPIQFFSSSKYTKGGFLTAESFEKVSYVYVTASVADWKKYVIHEDRYDEELAEDIRVIVSGAAPLSELKYDVDQLGDFMVEVYDKYTEYLENSYDDYITTEYGRYINKFIAGKQNTDEVSILVAAYRSKSKKNIFTGQWENDNLTYAYPWADEVIHF